MAASNKNRLRISARLHIVVALSSLWVGSIPFCAFVSAAESHAPRPTVLTFPRHDGDQRPTTHDAPANNEHQAQAADAVRGNTGIQLPNGDVLDVAAYQEWDRVPARNGRRLRAAVHPRGMHVSELTYPDGSVLGRIGHNGTILHGTCEILHPNGAKMLSGTFSDGDRQGNFTVWDANGVPRHHSHHGGRGHRHRYATYCDELGNVLLIAKYTSGTRQEVYRVENGRVVETVSSTEEAHASEQLSAAIAAAEDIYQLANATQNAAAELLKNGVHQQRALLVASRATAVAAALQQKQNALAAGQSALIQNLRERSGF